MFGYHAKTPELIICQFLQTIYEQNENQFSILDVVLLLLASLEKDIGNIIRLIEK